MPARGVRCRLAAFGSPLRPRDVRQAMAAATIIGRAPDRPEGPRRLRTGSQQRYDVVYHSKVRTMDTTRASLLLRIRDRRDSQSWREFDAIYRPLLYRFARASGAGREEAEEVAQQCMVAISGHIDRFEYDPEKGRFKAWLRTVANNTLRKQRRGRRPQQAKTRDFDGLQAREPSPEDVFERLWLEEHLRHCIELVRGEVQDSSFTAFKRYVLEKEPVEQVCRELDMTANQVYRIKWRLTQKLDEKMKALLEGSES